MSQILIVIPARYNSTRLPGKPLVEIAGVKMLKRVANIAQSVVSQQKDCSYLVATDDTRISFFCSKHNIPWILTSDNCSSGTERCYEVVQKLEEKPHFIINLQGDNPLCPPWFIEALIDSWRLSQVGEVFTPYVSLSWQELDSLRESKNITPFSGTTVQITQDEQALTFSKNIIPAIRNEASWRVTNALSPIKRHIGLYGYTLAGLTEYFAYSESNYEKLEGLEQMRFLEHGIPIKMVEVDYRGRNGMCGIDSPEDIKRAEDILKKDGELELSHNGKIDITQNIQDLVSRIIDTTSLTAKYHLESINALFSVEDFQAIFDRFNGIQKRIDEPVLKIVAGVPCSGKSHYINVLREEYPDAFVLQFDDIMCKFNGYCVVFENKGKEAAFAEYELPARWIGYQLLIRALEKNVSIIWEHSSALEQHVDLYKIIYHKSVYQVEMLYIDTPMEIIMQRTLKERDKGRFLPIEYITERSEKLKALLPIYQKCIPFKIIES